MLTKQKEQKESVESFRSALSDLSAILTDPQGVLAGNRPLIFIVDELDIRSGRVRRDDVNSL